MNTLQCFEEQTISVHGHCISANHLSGHLFKCRADLSKNILISFKIRLLKAANFIVNHRFIGDNLQS